MDIETVEDGSEIGGANAPAKGAAMAHPRSLPTVTLIPDELSALLRPRQNDAPERLHSPWHRVKPPQGMLVTLRAPKDRPLLLRLMTRSDAPHFRARWLRWTFASRYVSELEGGEGVSAKDTLSADGCELQLALLPGETRLTHLECCAWLDGETAAGDYPFQVVVREADDVLLDVQETALSLRHPQSFLLDYLPTPYQKTREPVLASDQSFDDRSFFERMLLGYEDALQPLRDMLGSIERFFDPDDTPPDFLPWLATWLGLALDDNWPQMRRRRLIKEAVELYRWRGTRRSLSRYLEIYCGVKPEINDKPFTGMKLGAETKLGRGTILGGVPPHTFVVTLAVPDIAAVDEPAVHRIIEAEKPAHTAYTLNIVERSPELAPATTLMERDVENA